MCKEVFGWTHSSNAVCWRPVCWPCCYGYQIIKDLGACIEISESTLYPILKRLETAGCLTVYTVEHNGRLRKYYRIMPAGRQRVQEFLQDWKTIMDVYEFIKGE